MSHATEVKVIEVALKFKIYGHNGDISKSYSHSTQVSPQITMNVTGVNYRTQIYSTY